MCECVYRFGCACVWVSMCAGLCVWVRGGYVGGVGVDK